MTSRALIAGATGLIGSNLANHLVSKGWEVYGHPLFDQCGTRVAR
jgi:nucleoside-diphosphate-sugar epimerase